MFTVLVEVIDEEAEYRVGITRLQPDPAVTQDLCFHFELLLADHAVSLLHFDREELAVGWQQGRVVRPAGGAGGNTKISFRVALPGDVRLRVDELV